MKEKENFDEDLTLLLKQIIKVLNYLYNENENRYEEIQMLTKSIQECTKFTTRQKEGSTE